MPWSIYVHKHTWRLGCCFLVLSCLLFLYEAVQVMISVVALYVFMKYYSDSIKGGRGFTAWHLTCLTLTYSLGSPELISSEKVCSFRNRETWRLIIRDPPTWASSTASLTWMSNRRVLKTQPLWFSLLVVSMNIGHASKHPYGCTKCWITSRWLSLS